MPPCEKYEKGETHFLKSGLVLCHQIKKVKILKSNENALFIWNLLNIHGRESQGMSGTLSRFKLTELESALKMCVYCPADIEKIFLFETEIFDKAKK